MERPVLQVTLPLKRTAYGPTTDRMLEQSRNKKKKYVYVIYFLYRDWISIKNLFCILTVIQITSNTFYLCIYVNNVNLSQIF